LGFTINFNGFFEKNSGIIIFVIIILSVVIFSLRSGKKNSSKGAIPLQPVVKD
jgi:hypothetical protein